MERKAFLEQKLEKVKNELLQWAQENLEVYADEEVVVNFHVQITKKAPLVIQATTQVGAYRQVLRNLATPLREEDWERILSVRYPKEWRYIVEYFHASENEPCAIRTIGGNEEKHWLSPANIVGSLNASLKVAGLPYRLRSAQHSSGEYKFFIVE